MIVKRSMFPSLLRSGTILSLLSLTEGRYPESDDEVVVDQSFENYGIKLGDAIQLNGSEASYKIVGLTQGNKFFTEPVVFTSFDNLLDFDKEP